MNSIESAFIPYSPQRMPTAEKQNFFFVTYTGDPVSKNKAARKTIRAQASRASASQRIETTAFNRSNGKSRCKSNSPIKRERIHSNTPTPPRVRKSTMHSVSSFTSDPLRLHSLSLQLAVQQPDPLAGIADWECAIPSLIRENFVKAVLEMRRKQIGCDLQTLTFHFSQAPLYNDNLMLMILELLSTTAFNSPGSRPSVSRPVIMALWSRALYAIQAAISDCDASWSLGPALILLAGWELGCGESQHCESHLRILSRIMYGDCNHQYSTSLPDEAFVYCVPSRECAIAPPGFDFFSSQNLLPSCLMSVLSTFGQCDPCNLVYLPHIRRIGLAALSCQPSSASAIQSAKLHEINSRIAQHVRLAAALLSAMAQADCEHQFPNALPELQVWFDETLTLDSESLVGTVYDQILLWALCIFAAAAFVDPHYSEPKIIQQRPAIERLLKASEIHTWDSLTRTLERYAWSTFLGLRLHFTLAGILSN